MIVNQKNILSNTQQISSHELGENADKEIFTQASEILVEISWFFKHHKKLITS